MCDKKKQNNKLVPLTDQHRKVFEVGANIDLENLSGFKL